MFNGSNTRKSSDTKIMLSIASFVVILCEFLRMLSVFKILCYFLTVRLCLLFVRLIVGPKHFCLLENSGSSRPLGSRDVRASNSLTERRMCGTRGTEHLRVPSYSEFILFLNMYPLQIGVLGSWDLKN